MQMLEENSKDWSDAKYNLIHHNCNDFTNLASEFLTGKGISKDILN